MPTETGIFTPLEAQEGHLFSYRLAQFLANSLKKKLPLYDYGCGPGAYLRYFEDVGFKEVTGIEGTREQEFEVPSYKVLIKDLTVKLNLSTRVGNVICLEVGEHIPEQFTETFLDNITELVAKDCFLCLSWAVPGQDGTGHVNCQPNEWVIEKLKARGYTYLPGMTTLARDVVENHLAYFKHSLLIFVK